MLSPVVADPSRASEGQHQRVIGSALIRLALIALPAPAVLVAPAPADLPVRAQRVLAVVILAIGLWSTEIMAAGVTAVVVIVALIYWQYRAGFRGQIRINPTWGAPPAPPIPPNTWRPFRLSP